MNIENPLGAKSLKSTGQMFMNFPCGLGGSVVRRRAHDPRAHLRIRPWPHLRIASLGKVLAQIVPLSTQEYKWVPGP